MASITSANRPIINADERRFLGVISPHVRRAAMIGDLLDHRRVETQTYRAALDRLTTAVLLVDRHGSIVYRNEAAAALLAAGRHIRCVGKSFGPANAISSDGLASAIAMATENQIDFENRGIAIPVSHADEPPAVAYVLPLAMTGLRSSFNPAVAAVFISTTISGMPTPEHALATIYGLTPAESRVMVQVGAGQTTAGIAAAFGVSENTIKTHLARLFGKTGTSRQSELVKIVTQLASPLSAS